MAATGLYSCRKDWAAGVAAVGSSKLEDILGMAVTRQLWEQRHETQNSIPSGTNLQMSSAPVINKHKANLSDPAFPA